MTTTSRRILSIIAAVFVAVAMSGVAAPSVRAADTAKTCSEWKESYDEHKGLPYETRGNARICLRADKNWVYPSVEGWCSLKWVGSGWKNHPCGVTGQWSLYFGGRKLGNYSFGTGHDQVKCAGSGNYTLVVDWYTGGAVVRSHGTDSVNMGSGNLSFTTALNCDKAPVDFKLTVNPIYQKITEVKHEYDLTAINNGTGSATGVAFTIETYNPAVVKSVTAVTVTGSNCSRVVPKNRRSWLVLTCPVPNVSAGAVATIHLSMKGQVPLPGCGGSRSDSDSAFRWSVTYLNAPKRVMGPFAHVGCRP